MQKTEQYKLEIFCGTGGVGKTTLAASRALHLSQQGKKVLLITIDPAQRLKQILGLKDKGTITDVSSDLFGQPSKKFYAMLLDPAQTLFNVAQSYGVEKNLNNKIVKILTRPHGGMNEIMALVEVQFRWNEDQYDVIILDTPPGKHFLDFLSSTKRINKFFDRSFVDIFKYLGKDSGEEGRSKRFISLIVKTGIKKLLSYLEKVTGSSFVDEFLNSLSGIYKSREVFLQALTLEKKITETHEATWYLVTAVDQQKIDEALKMQTEIKKSLGLGGTLAINKSLEKFLNNWDLEKSSPLFPYKQSLQSRENELKSKAKNQFRHIKEFPEILDSTPEKHVKELANSWS